MNQVFDIIHNKRDKNKEFHLTVLIFDVPTLKE